MILKDYTFNEKILEKIDDLDESDEYKEFLKNILDFEKLQSKLGDKDFTREYEKRLNEYILKNQE